MSSILFGLILISATLQTALAMFAEGQLVAMPLLAVLIYAGWRFMKGGVGQIKNKVSPQSGAADTHVRL
jgi:hypothetical protein